MMKVLDRKPDQTASQIVAILETHKADLQRFGVRRIGLFGSYRRGAATPTSDMDLLVRLEKPTFDVYMDLKFYLEDLFDCPVDLVMEENIKPRLRPHILPEVIYAQGL